MASLEELCGSSGTGSSYPPAHPPPPPPALTRTAVAPVQQWCIFSPTPQRSAPTLRASSPTPRARPSRPRPGRGPRLQAQSEVNLRYTSDAHKALCARAEPGSARCLAFAQPRHAPSPGAPDAPQGRPLAPPRQPGCEQPPTQHRAIAASLAAPQGRPGRHVSTP